jgi:hypothetical protein
MKRILGTTAAVALLLVATGAEATIPADRYAVTTETVRDLETGLTWQRVDDATMRLWSSARDYCDALILGGFRDWRLPTIRELQSLVDVQAADPAISPFFTGTAGAYWTATPDAGNPDYGVWVVGFQHGESYTEISSVGGYRVRCVR